MEEQRLTNILNERDKAINKSDSVYNQLAQDNKDLYDQQQNYANEYERIQNENLDKQLAFNEQKIEQQKEIAKQNKETEDLKAKNDYEHYINPYGQQAESLAGNGLLNTGLSETMKMGGFNTYQNRLASSNKAMQDAITAYDNDMNQARLTNDVQKAQNALSKLQMNLEYTQNYISNNSDIQKDKLSNSQSLNSDYNSRYQTEYQNIQNEKAQQEAIRQFNEEMAYKREQAAQAQANWEKEYNLNKYSTYSKYSGGGDGSYPLTDSEVNTAYFQGAKNPDAKEYGTFSNGYQPKGISGHGALTKTKDTVTFNTKTLYGQKQTVTQNVWKAEDGTKWYWDGTQNKYIKFKKK